MYVFIMEKAVRGKAYRFARQDRSTLISKLKVDLVGAATIVNDRQSRFE